MKQAKTQLDYVTKKDLDKSLRDLYIQISDRFDIKFEAIRKDQLEYHSENMNRFDDVMKRLDDLSVDNEVGAYQIKDAREDIRNLEKRVQKLEKS